MKLILKVIIFTSLLGCCGNNNTKCNTRESNKRVKHTYLRGEPNFGAMMYTVDGHDYIQIEGGLCHKADCRHKDCVKLRKLQLWYYSSK